ncbi:PPC domain-containing protein [Butyrivibrio sp. JL13D10]|uniref:PPC domain-containing protein n=1 Tax=Butyrivibrio sp. JL13D10 TaxID=3236815 RepID=UPI0038B694C0
MKKKIKLLSLMLSAILTATAFHATDSSVETVSAKGENYLDPIMVNVGPTPQKITSTGNEENWYAFDIPEDGDLKITITGDQIHIRKFLATSKSILLDKYVYKNEPYVSHFTATSGRYYLNISCYSDSFNLTVDFKGYGFKDEFDDVYENPKSYAPGTEAIGAVSYADEYDWYKFEIPENGKYKISYIANTGSYHFGILDSDLRNVWSHDFVSDNELKTSTIYFAAGTYYIKIEGRSCSKYKFNISKLGITPTSLKKVKSNKKGIAEIKFKRVEDVDGYQIRVALDKKFTKKVKVRTFDVSRYYTSKSLVAVIKKLKRHKNYYVQIRSYEKYDNDTYYFSDWSKTKKVKIK